MKLLFVYIFTALFSLINNPGYPGDWYVKEYHPNGKMKIQGWLLQSQKTAWWTTFHTNGLVESEGNYENDQKSGWWKFFDKQGNKTAEGRYLAGRREGWWHFHHDGRYTLGKYIGGQKDYYWKTFRDQYLIDQQVWDRGELKSFVELKYTTPQSGTYRAGRGNEIISRGKFRLADNESTYYFYDNEGELIYTQNLN